jgi:DNA anti-recombination protein RmuC
VNVFFWWCVISPQCDVEDARRRIELRENQLDEIAAACHRISPKEAMMRQQALAAERKKKELQEAMKKMEEDQEDARKKMEEEAKSTLERHRAAMSKEIEEQRLQMEQENSKMLDKMEEEKTKRKTELEKAREERKKEMAQMLHQATEEQREEILVCIFHMFISMYSSLDSTFLSMDQNPPPSLSLSRSCVCFQLNLPRLLLIVIVGKVPTRTG